MGTHIAIFISYVIEDELAVAELCKDLVERNFIILSGRQIQHDELNGLVSQAPEMKMEDADFFLACLSKNAVGSSGKLDPEMHRELMHLWRSIDAGTFVIPVRLEECIIPDFLEAFEPIDVFKERGKELLIETTLSVYESRRQLSEAFPQSAKTKILEQQDGESLEGPLDPESVIHWAIDLRRLITGEREDSLLRLGGVEEYVEVMLSESEDSAAAQQAFVEALEQIVQSWQPSTFEGEMQIGHMLDLVSAYTPKGGFVKVMALVQAFKRMSQNNGDETPFVDDDQYLKAFVALENYYPIAPPFPEDQSPAYRTYIEVLSEDLTNATYGGYALKRLVELKVMELGSNEVEYLIQTNPNNLVTLVGLILDPARHSKTQEELVLVYNYCLRAGYEIEQEFGQAVTLSGGSIERSFESGPKVHFRGNTFLIDLHDVTSKYLYSEMILQRERAEGAKKFSTLTAGA